MDVNTRLLKRRYFFFPEERGEEARAVRPLSRGRVGPRRAGNGAESPAVQRGSAPGGGRPMGRAERLTCAP